MNDDGGKVEISADTPIGKLAAKGMRISDLIGLFTLLGVVTMMWSGVQLVQSITEHEVQTHSTNKEIITSIKEAAKAQRMNTCILSVSQDKREQEFMQPNGFCARISSMP